MRYRSKGRKLIIVLKSFELVSVFTFTHVLLHKSSNLPAATSRSTKSRRHWLLPSCPHTFPNINITNLEVPLCSTCSGKGIVLRNPSASDQVILQYLIVVCVIINILTSSDDISSNLWLPLISYRSLKLFMTRTQNVLSVKSPSHDLEN